MQYQVFKFCCVLILQPWQVTNNNTALQLKNKKFNPERNLMNKMTQIILSANKYL